MPAVRPRRGHIGPTGPEVRRSSGSGGGGIRTTPEFPEETTLLERRGAESGALASTDPDLALLIKAWQNLPDPIKAGILAMVRAAGG